MEPERMYSQEVEGVPYEVYRYWIPCNLNSKIDVIKKWGQAICRESIPKRFRRRKNRSEYAETAVMIFARIDQFISLDIPFTVGSGYLSQNQWATFGEVENPNSEHTFRRMADIGYHYKKNIVGTGRIAHYFHFRTYPLLAQALAYKHDTSAHNIMSVAILLLHDLIVNAGPDCEEFYDLFTNDTRVKPEHIDVNDWRKLRVNIFGNKKGKSRPKRTGLLANLVGRVDSV